MKSFRLVLLIVLLLVNAGYAFADSLSLAPGESRIINIPINEQGKYELVLNSLSLGDGSVFFLSQNLVGKNVSLVIEKLSVFGKAYIAQEPHYDVDRTMKSSERLSLGVIDTQLSQAGKGAEDLQYL